RTGHGQRAVGGEYRAQCRHTREEQDGQEPDDDHVGDGAGQDAVDLIEAIPDDRHPYGEGDSPTAEKDESVDRQDVVLRDLADPGVEHEDQATENQPPELLSLHPGALPRPEEEQDQGERPKSNYQEEALVSRDDRQPRESRDGKRTGL